MGRRGPESPDCQYDPCTRAVCIESAVAQAIKVQMGWVDRRSNPCLSRVQLPAAIEVVWGGCMALSGVYGELLGPIALAVSTSPRGQTT
jgi:hypothetical protein